MVHKADFERVAWQCVHFPRSFPAEVEDAIRRDGISVRRFRMDHAITKERLLRGVAEAMRFPQWFGMNWDALNDCLRDMEWEPARGHVLVLECEEEVDGEGFRVIGGLIESWLTAAEFWSKRGLPFHLVILAGSGGAGE